MARDILMEQIWKIREELVAEHGGIENYFNDVIRRDAERRRKLRQSKAKRTTSKSGEVKPSAKRQAAARKRLMSDPLMEQVWSARANLLAKHGGMDGLLKHVLQQEKARRKPALKTQTKKRKTLTPARSSKQVAVLAK